LEDNMPTCRVGPQTIYYDEYGSGQPLLLIPGLGGTRLGWRKQTEALSHHFRVINLDNRDAGDSGQAGVAYSIDDMADDIAGLITQLDAGRAHVVGTSMGGFITQHLALRHSEILNKIVLVATTAGGPETVRGKPEIGALLQRDDGEDVETRMRRTLPLIAGPGYMAAHPEDLDEAVRGALALPMPLEAYQRQFGAAEPHVQNGLGDRLPQIKASTLVVHGEADPLIPVANGRYLAAHIPGARLITYPGIGHLLPVEAAERFNRDVLEFLGS
jgi:pimeloyl-ACP methyl ester carboxylesterase